MDQPIDRRTFLATWAATAALGSGLVRAQEFKFKLGTDLPVTHSVNVRLKEAIDAIAADTKGKVAIQLFPNNQLGSDSDMMSQIRSCALELATFPGTVMSTLVPVTSVTGVGFAFTGYDKVWAAMDGAVGKHIRAAIEKNPRARRTFGTLSKQNLLALTFRTNNMRTPAGRARKRRAASCRSRPRSIA